MQTKALESVGLCVEVCQSTSGTGQVVRLCGDDLLWFDLFDQKKLNHELKIHPIVGRARVLKALHLYIVVPVSLPVVKLHLQLFLLAVWELSLEFQVSTPESPLKILKSLVTTADLSVDLTDGLTVGVSKCDTPHAFALRFNMALTTG